MVNVAGKILETAGKRTVVAGNIGTPFASVVEKRDPYDVIVLEISSFQLDTIIDFRADVAVLTTSPSTISTATRIPSICTRTPRRGS